MGLKSSDLIPGTLQKRFVFCRMPACYVASCLTPVLQNFDTLMSEVRVCSECDVRAGNSPALPNGTSEQR